MTRGIVGAFVLTAGVLSAAAAAAQDAGYLVLHGNDTVAVEHVSRSTRGVTGDLTVGGRMRITYDARTDSAALVPEIRFEFHAPGAAAPAATGVMEFRGDNAVARVQAPGAPPVQRFSPGAGALPYVNLATGILEQFVRRALAVGGERVSIPLLSVENGFAGTAVVSRPSPDSAVIRLPPGVDVHLEVDAEGRVLAGTVPAQGIVLARAGEPIAALPPPDYSAPPGAPYVAEEVEVPTPAGFTLGGTLTLPERRTGRVPAVVLITGSGPEDRDEAIPGIAGYRPFRQIADTLSRRGIAVLRLDDRGVGASGGSATSATSADFADDVRAAVAYLRDRPEVRGDRIGLLGHSEGGIIAPLVAGTDPGVRAVALMAAPAQSGREILLYQNREAIRSAPGLTEAQRDSLWATVPAKLDSLAGTHPWLRYFLDYDPLPAAARLRVPVLILHGATDHQVTPEQAQQLAEAMRGAGNRDVTVHVFPDLNHLFLPDPVGGADLGRYASLPSKELPPEVLGTLADWLARALR